MNLYSGFLIALMLICSSLFYGLARTRSSDGVDPLQGQWQLQKVELLTAQGWQAEPIVPTELRWFVFGQTSGFSLSDNQVAQHWYSGHYVADANGYHEVITQGANCRCSEQAWQRLNSDTLVQTLSRDDQRIRQYWHRLQ